MLDPLYRPGPGAPELVLARDYRQPPAKLWAAISTPERIAAWMDVEWRGDAELKLGARYAFLFRHMGMLTEGRVTAFEPGVRLAHTWFDNDPSSQAEIRWEIEPRGAGSRLTLTHVFTGVHDDAARTGVGWSELLDALARGLGEESDPQDALGWKALHRRLMGVLPPAAIRDGRVWRRADGGWTLTFDRHLAFPLAEVWKTVSTAEGMGAWMAADAVFEPRVGGRYRLAFHDAPGVTEGEVTAFEPERRLALARPENEGSKALRLAIDVAADPEGGTRLLLTHDGPDASELVTYAAAWHERLDQVELRLGGGAPVGRGARLETLRKVYGMILFADHPGGAPEAAGAGRS